MGSRSTNIPFDQATAAEEAFREANFPFVSLHTGKPIPMHTPVSPSPLSEMEATFYYAGIPSDAPLVARSSDTPWEMPTGLGMAKELRPAGRHVQMHEAWKGGLSPKIVALLDSMKVNELAPMSSVSGMMKRNLRALSSSGSVWSPNLSLAMTASL